MLRCWNIPLPNETVQCTQRGGSNTCGQVAHEVLEFGATPTGPAAAYPVALCGFIGGLLLDGASRTASASDARASADLISEGRVKRHALRGTTDEGARERKRAEDDAAQAGMRNPATVCKSLSSLVEAMSPVQSILLALQRGHPGFRA